MTRPKPSDEELTKDAYSSIVTPHNMLTVVSTHATGFALAWLAINYAREIDQTSHELLGGHVKTR